MFGDDEWSRCSAMMASRDDNRCQQLASVADDRRCRWPAVAMRADDDFWRWQAMPMAGDADGADAQPDPMRDEHRRRKQFHGMFTVIASAMLLNKVSQKRLSSVSARDSFVFHNNSVRLGYVISFRCSGACRKRFYFAAGHNCRLSKRLVRHVRLITHEAIA